jgi:LuxR family transcriptional regulator, maltose regulon positive regulatory protein
VRGLAWLAQANLQRELGDFEQAIFSYRQALPLLPSIGVQSGTYNLITAFGQVYLVQGDLRTAEELYGSYLAQIDETGQGRSPAVGILQSDLGAIEYEQNRLAEARSLFEKGEANSQRSGMVDLVTSIAILGARLSRADRDLPGALQRLKEAHELVRSADAPNLSREVSAWLARLQAEAGEIREAEAWAREIRPCPDHNPGYTHGIELFTLVRVLICQGRLEEAFQLVARLDSLAGAGHSLGRVVEARLLQAEILWAQGHPGQAIARLLESMELAAPGGSLRVFLDEGSRLLPILAAWQLAAPAEAAQNRFALGVLDCLRQESRPAAPGEDLLAETEIADLTAREMDVLRGLIQGWSYPEIAERLVISPGTVKTHVSHIYAKLGVQGRTQAIRRAQELKIG